MDSPGAWQCAVAAAGIGTNQQALGLRVSFSSHQVPPTANTFDSKFRCFMGNAHVDDSFIPRHIVGPVRDRLAPALRRKIVDVDRRGVAFRLPATTAIIEGSHQFLLLRVHADDRVMVTHKAPNLIIEIAKLRIAIWMLGTLDRLYVSLQGVA